VTGMTGTAMDVWRHELCPQRCIGNWNCISAHNSDGETSPANAPAVGCQSGMVRRRRRPQRMLIYSHRFHNDRRNASGPDLTVTRPHWQLHRGQSARSSTSDSDQSIGTVGELRGPVPVTELVPEGLNGYRDGWFRWTCQSTSCTRSEFAGIAGAFVFGRSSYG